MVRLEMRRTDSTGAIVKYQAVETPDKETTIQEYVKRYGAPLDVFHHLLTSSDYTVGNDTYSFHDQDGKLIPVPDYEEQFTDVHGFTPDWKEVEHESQG